MKILGEKLNEALEEHEKVIKELEDVSRKNAYENESDNKETFSIRFDSKTRYLLEINKRLERRPISEFIIECVINKLKDLESKLKEIENDNDN